MKTNILILCAGQTGFETHREGYPLCLTEMEGVSLLEKIVANTNTVLNSQHIFALLDKDIENFHLDKIVNMLVPGAVIVGLSESTQGSACTALLASCQLDPEASLLIISGNELVDIDFGEMINEFHQRGLEGGTLIFHSVHPRYSYVRLNSNDLVTEAMQQNPISQHATAGVFWFAKGGNFVDAAKNLIRKDASVGGKFYVAPVFNELLLKRAKIGVIRLDVGKYHPLKNEQQVQKFEREVKA